ncbi:hypothetical protein D3C86_2106310 [compost metagenome]
MCCCFGTFFGDRFTVGHIGVVKGDVKIRDHLLFEELRQLVFIGVLVTGRGDDDDVGLPNDRQLDDHSLDFVPQGRTVPE